MTKTAKKTWVYLAIFLIFSIAAVAVRTAAILLDLDDLNIYFNSPIIVMSSVALCFTFALIAISYIFISDKDMKLYANFKTPGTYIPSGIVAVSLLFLGGELFAKTFLFKKVTAEYFSSASSIISVTATLLSIICVLNFFFNVFHEKKESTARASFCLLCALFLGAYAGYLFFSDELPINAPNKAADQIAYLALAIFFLYETRISLGRAKWRMYFATGLIAANLAFYSAIPSLIYMLTNGIVISNSIAENVLTFTLGIYVTSRIALMATLPQDRICDTVIAISEMSERRKDDIRHHENLHGTLNFASPDTVSVSKSTEIGTNYEMEIFPDTQESDTRQESFNFDDNN